MTVDVLGRVPFTVSDRWDCWSSWGAQVRLAVTAVLMQPTTLCNLDCTYCYLPDRIKARVMPVQVADAVAEAVAAWSQVHPVRVLWHGGEPLATGLPHFARLIGRLGPGRLHPARHGVQTNATLIDDRWCELFATVPVAVSTDGAVADDTAGVDRSGRDSAARTARRIDLLRATRSRSGRSRSSLIPPRSAGQLVIISPREGEVGRHQLRLLPSHRRDLRIPRSHERDQLVAGHLLRRRHPKIYYVQAPLCVIDTHCHRQPSPSKRRIHTPDTG